MRLSPEFDDGICEEEREVGGKSISEDAWLLKCFSLHFLFTL